jgi:hypothetical protein
MNDPKLCNEMGKNGRNYVLNNFDFEKFTSIQKEIVKNI